MARRPYRFPTKPAQVRPPRPVIREFNDRGWRWLFGDACILVWFLHIAAPDVAERLDVARAEPVDRSFLPPDLRRAESDVIWRIPYRVGDPAEGRFLWIRVLLEQQTLPDPEMTLRVLLYMTHLWARQKAELEAAEVPPAERRYTPILPMVFYTGTEVWDFSPRLLDLIDCPEGMAPCVPAWETLFVPLRDLPPEQVAAAGPLAPVLRVMQQDGVRGAPFHTVVARGLEELNRMPEDMLLQWLRLVHFLRMVVHHRRGARERPILDEMIVQAAERSKFRRTAQREIAMTEKTYAEVLRDEGKAEGEAKGRVEGTTTEARSFLEELLRARFGPLPEGVQARIEQETRDGCRELGRRLLGARSLADLFPT